VAVKILIVIEIIVEMKKKKERKANKSPLARALREKN